MNEDAGERHTTEGVEGGEERADERLLLFVRHELDLDPPGPFQTAREEVEELLGAVVVSDPSLATERGLSSENALGVHGQLGTNRASLRAFTIALCSRSSFCRATFAF